MNFARHQEQAERAARRLVVLYALVSATVVLGVSAIAALGWHLLFGFDVDPPRGFHAGVLAGVVVIVFGGAWRETVRLREDGALIARRLGAVPVDTVADPLHRRLQNVLEELAIAARIGVPRAFVIEDEPTINALTAGMDPNQSVVVVTRGALAHLTRDELQGVLAHEISHVVNGDVRLNTRLVGLNHGLRWVGLSGRTLIADGFGLERRSRWWSGTGPSLLVAAVGVALAALGWVGDLAARAIQAAVGRQREFHADAQAVAFTRSRDGLGGALRKVAGQAGRPVRGAAGRPSIALRRASLRHPYLHDVAHLLLVGGETPARWFETHPPLRERVQRIYGRAMSPIEPRELAEPERREPELPALAFAMDVASRADDDAADPQLVPVRARRGATADPGWIDTLPALAFESSPVAGGDGAGAGSARGPAAAGGAEADGAAAVADGAAAEARGVAASAAATRLVQATREPAGAAALVVALVAGDEGPEPQWDAGWACAAPRFAALRAALSALPSDTVRAIAWPLSELAVARLRPLSRPSREALFTTVRGVALADDRLTLREWIHLGLLRRRLRLEPGSRMPGLAARADARSIRVLFAVVAQCAQVSEAKADRAANAAIRALDLDPIGGTAGPLSAESVERAMRAAAALRPLARPLLVRQLVSLLPGDASPEVCDFLRLLCVAIDSPPPRLPSRGRPRAGAPDAPFADEDDEVFATADA